MMKSSVVWLFFNVSVALYLVNDIPRLLAKYGYAGPVVDMLTHWVLALLVTGCAVYLLVEERGDDKN